MKLLIIEDEEELVDSIVSFFMLEGHVCESSISFEQGVEKISLYEYDCVIADIGLHVTGMDLDASSGN